MPYARLKANWFAGGLLHKRGEPPSRPVFYDAALDDQLPSGAERVDDDEAQEILERPAVNPEGLKTLAELANPRKKGMAEHLKERSDRQSRHPTRGRKAREAVSRDTSGVSDDENGSSEPPDALLARAKRAAEG